MPYMSWPSEDKEGQKLQVSFVFSSFYPICNYEQADIFNIWQIGRYFPIPLFLITLVEPIGSK